MKQLPSTITILPLMDEHGHLTDCQHLNEMLRIHKQLRPMLPDNIEAYTQLLKRMAKQGARLLLAESDEVPMGIAIYRIYENTYEGLRLYVDDLIVDETCRSQGAGHALLEYCRQIACQAGCGFLTLDSGAQRAQAHKMYFREGLTITAFHFTQALSK